MTDALRALIEISAALALSDAPLLERALSEAKSVTTARAIEEALLQSFLFLGYPAALRGFGAWRRMSGDAAQRGESIASAEWKSRGEATCARVYGGQYHRLRDNIAALHPELEEWMIGEGYGKVLSRPGLDLATRELCIIALLAPQDAAPQLYSHMRGALHAGAAENDVAEVVQFLEPMLPAVRATALAAQWQAVRTRSAREA